MVLNGEKNECKYCVLGQNKKIKKLDSFIIQLLIGFITRK
jgi:hypothetical protein